MAFASFKSMAFVPTLDWVNENPILTREEISTFRNFFKMFQNEEGIASVSKMVDSLENLVDLNTGVIRKVLLWIRQMNNTPSELKSDHF